MNIEIVTVETVRNWIAAGEAVVVDVREETEFMVEHIAGATLVPLSIFDPSALPPSDGKRLVLHCRSGVRCGHAAGLMQDSGLDTIYRMEGGIIGWKQQGGPVVSP
ncbi:MAG: rhodanese-like domain-containing protein [Rhodospirillaceae bacterium]|jgi:rhodanese-related sulfurtransferase|nr:rhodanese-like domain-containing protein [Rhodospirillaceae bacterium]MBT5667556.1 rhodanese-like domain-containing protein [Rhodospirillaceae bacterium]MBT5808955.1 rhodanese-like domain-containing protein [Rhodospirillaceae bacterium]